VKGAIPVLLFLIIVLVLGSWMRKGINTTASALPSRTNTNVAEITVQETHGSMSAPKAGSPLIGEVILRDYAKTNLSPQNDLNLMSHLMDNSLLLLKSAANRPLSANEDWADFLKGQNSIHERFLTDNHVALNSAGQLIDRWGTPLFFHALGGGRYEIRSAGPDKLMWTGDDIHRNSDGSFRHGTDLNPAALATSEPIIRKRDR